MSEYEVYKDTNVVCIVKGEKIVQILNLFEVPFADIMVAILNREVAPLSKKLDALRQQIADLEAENAKLKADCASYDKALNDVAIGYLEATEKLQQLEAQESPALEPLADSSIVWNMAYAEKVDAIVTPAEDIAEGFMRPCESCNGSGTQKHFLYDHLTTHCDDCGGTGVHMYNLLFEPQGTYVRVNWSENGYSSGSYKVVKSFSKFERNWVTIEIVTDKISHFTVRLTRCEVVL